VTAIETIATAIRHTGCAEGDLAGNLPRINNMLPSALIARTNSLALYQYRRNDRGTLSQCYEPFENSCQYVVLSTEDLHP